MLASLSTITIHQIVAISFETRSTMNLILLSQAK